METEENIRCRAHFSEENDRSGGVENDRSGGVENDRSGERIKELSFEPTGLAILKCSKLFLLLWASASLILGQMNESPVQRCGGLLPRAEPSHKAIPSCKEPTCASRAVFTARFARAYRTVRPTEFTAPRTVRSTGVTIHELTRG